MPLALQLDWQDALVDQNDLNNTNNASKTNQVYLLNIPGPQKQCKSPLPRQKSPDAIIQMKDLSKPATSLGQH